MTTKHTITKGYMPGAIGRIAELHGRYYHEHWGFGLFFEAKVATELSTFLERYDDRRDGIWLATVAGRVEGAVVIDGIHAGDQGAHLRWFIVSDALRGTGAGRVLMDRAKAFCCERAFGKVYLWTFAGLDAARHLYEDFGFRLEREQSGDQWGTRVAEQQFACSMDSAHGL